MKIQYCSDLHLEFDDNSSYLRNNPLTVAGDYLILAGDISYMGRIMKTDKWFFDWCSDNFKATYYVPGNHEFYDYSDISILENPYREALLPNVFFVSNYSVQIEGYDLLFTPLLSRIADVNNMIISFCMNDFRRILFHKKKMTIENYNLINSVCVSFLRNELEKTKNRVMIFTHHVPSRLCSSKEHNESPLSEAFANDLDDMILKYTDKISYWVFGHSHKSLAREIGRTTIVSNQLGYIIEHENTGFRTDACLEL
ncbi:MAG TPA: metallophosphoesterase [Bacteroidales bacterium]|nr:metallophosphoesterase [Bacteroidales bacterium]